MLILVLIPGIGTVRNGSRSWFGIGSLGLQPSEFTKLGLIIFTSKYLANNTKELKNIKKMNGNSVGKVKNNVSLMLSNLYYRMKLLADFIKGPK